jgi:sugar phosphate isomerase/epimerase
MDLPGMPSAEMAVALCSFGHDEQLSALVDQARALGYRWVALDAAHPQSRPRLLTRSAVRDIAATVRRAELRCAGVDLWIPRRHFADASHADKVAEALAAAAAFAAEIAGLTDGRPVLSTALPTPGADDEAERAEAVVLHAAEAASASGVRIADCAWPPRAASFDAASPIGVGLDPAAVIFAGRRDSSAADAAQAGDRASAGVRRDLVGVDPPQAASKAAGAIVSARLSDITAAGRVEPGAGALDLLAYEVALATAGYDGPVAVDLRGVAEPERLARRFAEPPGG